MNTSRRHHSAGVSLIEALVALAVMAFGILGVSGIQATLRANSDISRQRTEAVRIAQQAIEQWRSFTTVPTTAGQLAYDDIADETPPPITDTVYNTSYTLTKKVYSSPSLRAKTLVVSVGWKDRTNIDQSVGMSTVVAGISPDLPGALIVAGDASSAQQAKGRNAAIPKGAVDNTDGITSNFTPPGSGGGLTWVFNNVTGVITSICNPSCVTANSFLVSGYLNFAYAGAPLASIPNSPPLLRPDGTSAMTVVVNVTSPAIPLVNCFHQVVTSTPGYVAYFCAIPIPVPPAQQRWSGQAYLQLSSDLLPAVISTSLSDVTPTNYKVCRYTTAATDTPTPANNFNHPLTYVNVISALPNQNFLVVSAPYVTAVTGAGSCPIDGNPQVITYRHQPPAPS